MKLYNFEKFIDEKMIYRGEEYFLSGHVTQTNELAEGHFHATVSGSDNYTVVVNLDSSNAITYSECDCPYDLGPICKHETAVFFQLREKYNISKTSEPPLENFLKKMKKQQLIDLIMKQVEKNPDFEHEIRFMFGPKDDVVAISRNLVHEYIDAVTVNGFVSWNDAWDAVEGADLVLEKMEISIDMKEIRTAILLGEMVLTEMIDLTDYCDDSSGAISSIVYEAIRLMGIAIAEGNDIMADHEKLEIVQLLIEASRDDVYDGWNERRFSLLRNCIPYCYINDCKEMLEMELDAMLSKIKGSEGSAEHDRKEIKLIQFELLEKFSSPDKMDSFIENNMDITEIRAHAIEKSFKEADYQKVIELCLEGEERDHNLRGLVTQWQNYRYQAYEKLNDVDQQKSLATALLEDGDFNYFHKLKALYDESEWSEKLEQLTETLSQSYYNNGVYLQVLKEENLTGKMLIFCQKYPYHIEGLADYIVDEYPEELKDIYAKYIFLTAANSSNRKEYQQVCQMIRRFKKVCGNAEARAIIEELKYQYTRKLAFIDELSKVSL